MASRVPSGSPRRSLDTQKTQSDASTNGYVDPVEREVLLQRSSFVHFATHLRDIAAGKLDPPRRIGVSGWAVEDTLIWMMGHPSKGKTTVAAAGAVEYVRAGGHVIWLDWEMGERAWVMRMKECGATLDMFDSPDLGGRLHYIYSPPDGDQYAILANALQAWPRAAVVFDSASKALSRAGLTEKDNTEAGTWTQNYPQRAVKIDGARFAVVIDHVKQNATRAHPYPRGAGSKLADADIAWYVETTKRLDRETVGELRMTCKKDRHSVFAELPQSVHGPELHFRVGDGRGSLPLERIERQVTQSTTLTIEDDTERRQEATQKWALTVAAKQPRLSKRRLREAMTGEPPSKDCYTSTDRKREAIDALIESGRLLRVEDRDEYVVVD